jgi:hypothetical protein
LFNVTSITTITTSHIRWCSVDTCKRRFEVLFVSAQGGSLGGYGGYASSSQRSTSQGEKRSARRFTALFACHPWVTRMHALDRRRNRLQTAFTQGVTRMSLGASRRGDTHRRDTMSCPIAMNRDGFDCGGPIDGPIDDGAKRSCTSRPGASSKSASALAWRAASPPSGFGSIRSKMFGSTKFPTKISSPR